MFLRKNNNNRKKLNRLQCVVLWDDNITNNIILLRTSTVEYFNIIIPIRIIITSEIEAKYKIESNGIEWKEKNFQIKIIRSIE